ncbi:MAG: MoxR family ATPase [Cyanobacteria bacterium P01_A01_bin.15]
MRDRIDQIVQNLNKTIVGKQDPIRLVLVALLSGGHVLLEDVPGVGKTLLAKSLARCIDGKFQRVQCTPDLLPSDVTGTNIWNPSSGRFQFMPGPVFANVLLTDEINRATPRTQSALLEVMEENQVTLDGISRPVPDPFFVIATQNPVEYQGTFPLPEAQMDRFALSLSLGYPDANEELRMLQNLAQPIGPSDLQPCITLDEMHSLQQQCQQIKVEDSVQQYMIALVRATRDHDDVALGVSPRGTVALYRAVQALAFLEDRDYVLPDDVKALALPVLSHRLIASGGHKSGPIIAQLLDTVVVL